MRGFDSHSFTLHSVSGLALRQCPPIHVAGAPLGLCLCFLSRANTTTGILSTNTNYSNQPSRTPRQPWELWRLQLTLAELPPSIETVSLSSTCSLGSFATVSMSIPLSTTPRMNTTVTSSERPNLTFVWSVVNSCKSTTSKRRMMRLCSSPVATTDSHALLGVPERTKPPTPCG